MGTFDDLARSDFTFLPSGILYAGIWDLRGWRNTQLPWGSLKAVQDPLASRIQSVVAFPRMWGHFAFLYCSSCPYCQGTLCSAALGNSGLLWVSLIGSIPPSSCPLHSMPCIASLSPLILVFIWTGVSFTSFPRDVGLPNSSEYTLHFTVSFMLLGCGHRIGLLFVVIAVFCIRSWPIVKFLILQKLAPIV